MNIIQSEIIGMEIEVLKDSNQENIRIKGKVIDETMKTLIIKGENTIRIAKKDATFMFSLDCLTIKVNGKDLIGRPEDRIKKKIKQKW